MEPFLNNASVADISATSEPFTVYVAADGFTDDLVHELGAGVFAVRERLVLAYGPVQPAAWAQNIWHNPLFLPVTSIGDAARQLAALQRNWCSHPVEHHRRAALIQEKLPHVSAKPLNFGDKPPTSPLGSWTLWTPDTVLAAPHCSSPFPGGLVRFNENRIDPPSRAYLKLWELFTLMPLHPGPGELCLDLGAAPGGWSWVLGNLGAQVFAIDKAPLAPQVAAMPQVDQCLGSGFALDPRMAGAVDWLFSDMICYPDRLYEVISRWKNLGQCKRFVCTIKCQGVTDYETISRFAAMEHSRVLHLSCNKHELTWVSLLPHENNW